MKIDFEYINMRRLESKNGRKTSEWKVRNNRSGNQIGYIGWNPQWRRYCFSPVNYSVYSAGCLSDIGTFIEDLMWKRECERAAAKRATDSASVSEGG